MTKKSSSAILLANEQETKADNKKPKGFLKIFLIILATFLLSSIITLGGLAFYIYKQNPFNIQACLISSFLNASSIMDSKTSDSRPSAGAGTTKTASDQFDHPFLSPEQEVMLENAGIDVSTLPTTLSPEMKACGIDALGENRINEIINGATPGPLDLLRVKSCL
ncbi:hypothetical protein KAR28_02880 [Candidatus Parcubacteria bacterium]|nr:hypothetical protein [Candidatus Parcubacteria bacterium]